MSSSLENHLERLIRGESVVSLQGPADRLAERLTEFIRVEAFLRWYGGKYEEVISLPKAFAAFRKEVDSTSVTPEQIRTMYDEFGALIVSGRAELDRSIRIEKDRLKELARISSTIGLRVKGRVEAAEKALSEIAEKSSTAPHDAVRGLAKTLWSAYREAVDDIHAAISSVMSPGIVNIAKALLSGERFRLNKLDAEKLEALRTSPLAKALNLSFAS